ncbi:MAG: siderophore-interacting protein [Corynebacterium sp.]|nr:siderophore-interacting protein [Corynebacterium sp.]
MPNSFGVRLAEVIQLEQVSPHFVRVVFGGDDLCDAGTNYPICDQRFKLIFGDHKTLQDLRDTDDWFHRLRTSDAEDRPILRTYSIRDWGYQPKPRITVDFATHVGTDLGPAASWVQAAQPGDVVGMVLPLFPSDPVGVEFTPGAASVVHLIGDETALPAIGRILDDRAAFPRVKQWEVSLELPDLADQIIAPHPDYTIQAVARTDAGFGQSLARQLRIPLNGDQPVTAKEDTSDTLVWETASYSSEQANILEAKQNTAEHYYWIAGESSMVTSLRRYFVRELGVPREQIAFMGYWKHGVAMRE